MVAFSTILPFAAAFAAVNAVALPEPYVPPQSYYPSPTYASESAASTSGSYKLYPSDATPFVPEPVPVRTVSDAPTTTKSPTTHHSTHKPSKTKSKKTTTTSPSSTPTPPCTYDNFGLMTPVNGSTVTQIDDGNGDGTNITVLYCSGAYFKTSSIDIDVLLSSHQGGNALGGGELLAMNVKPDDNVAQGGFYGYLLNVTVYPVDGDYRTGPYDLIVYERTTGYYDAYEFNFATATLNFTVETKN